MYREIPLSNPAFACAWEHRGTGEHRVLPDNCADFIVSSAGTAWLVGPATSAELPTVRPGVTLRGLRIRTPAIGSIAGTDATELTDRQIPLDDLFGSLRARTITSALVDGRIDTLTGLWADTDIDKRAAHATATLTTSISSVNDIAATLGWSVRHLRRITLSHTGLPPKTLQRVARMHRALALPGEPTLSQRATTAGYLDQSHFARDVRALADLTPAELVVRHR